MAKKDREKILRKTTERLVELSRGADGRVDEARVVERRADFQVVHVVFDGNADFENFRIFKEREQHGNAAAVIEAEKIGAVFSAELHERHHVAGAFAEAGARLGVEAQNFFAGKRAHGFFRGLFVFDEHDFPAVLHQGQRADEIFLDAQHRASVVTFHKHSKKRRFPRKSKRYSAEALESVRGMA